MPTSSSPTARSEAALIRQSKQTTRALGELYGISSMHVRSHSGAQSVEARYLISPTVSPSNPQIS